MNPVGDSVYAANLVAFCRLLREAGLPLAPERTVQALEAVRYVGPARQDDVFYALRCVLVRDPAHFSLFERAFRAIFKAGAVPAAQRLPSQTDSADAGDWPASVREGKTDTRSGTGKESSAIETLRRKDFAAMTDNERDRARSLIAGFLLTPAVRPGRRQRAGRKSGAIDLRGTLQNLARFDGEILQIARQRPASQPESIVLLCDVSGSMRDYSRAYLQFAHALTRRCRHVSTFVFGTRLTPITQWLRRVDPDQALAATGQAVADWHGGTRISACLKSFHRHWSRRVLGRGGTIVLLTDGLERGRVTELGHAAAHLRRVCRRLLWLNPLMGYAGYEPSASGARALLPHVDHCLPGHTIDSLAGLSRALARPASRQAA